MLSFTIKNSSVIQIDCDDAGIETLMDMLSKLRTAGHLHLWAPPLGNDLSATSPFGERAVQEVIITHGGD